jgi:hypothetical protein
VSVKGGLSSAECEKQISAYEIVRTSTGSPLAYPGTVSATDVAKSYNLALLTDQPAQLLVAAENGTVTSMVSTNKIVSSGKAWSINQWKNATVFLPGTAFHPDLYYYVISNSTDTLTISHRTIRTDFNICPNIVTDGVKVADQFRFAGGQVTGPRLEGKRVRTTGTVTAVNSSQGYFDIDDGTVPAEANTHQDIWDTQNYGSSWAAPDGLRVSWAGTMPTVGSQVALKGCVGAARKKLQVLTTINGSPRDEVKVDKVYPMVVADSFVPLVEPLFTAVGMTATGFVAQVSLTPGEPYRLRASSDLQAWVDLTNFVAASTNYLLFDPAAIGQPRRFYRAVSP